MNFTIERHGHTIRAERRPASDRWREALWLTIDGDQSFPVSMETSEAEAASKYIGDPPPADHSKIWGSYMCVDCGASGVKLWRDYQAVLDAQTLRCKSCACTSEGKGPGSLSGDQIGWMVPAVPTSDGRSFWGYTSVPLAAVDWWQALPVE